MFDVLHFFHYTFRSCDVFQFFDFSGFVTTFSPKTGNKSLFLRILEQIL